METDKIIITLEGTVEELRNFKRTYNDYCNSYNGMSKEISFDYDPEYKLINGELYSMRIIGTKEKILEFIDNVDNLSGMDLGGLEDCLGWFNSDLEIIKENLEDLDLSK